ncbi:YgiQ family radical SAM protein [Fervidobacterium thailandense]|uniref:YgiQ family radical SAM protein n=1 Tax=Fervidobacterium thailandense TaxID=1008305 RepID=A0A1E3G130_9BACT|nr:YgiQ family radical SAM protein [Fervidobacterium thailandense]ODN29850.1 YgiQ family radical SAM protein [Fervidobacterium thailandense]
MRTFKEELKKFLPTTCEELELRNWDSLDIIFVTGDAYVDHPSFGVALLGRLLESRGYKVGIIAQPLNPEDIARLGKPNLFFGVTAGSLDSMVANYTASRKKRKSDDYTPGGLNNRRPDRAVIRYVNMIQQVFKDVPIVIGGIEASLRRFSHYDWWSDKVRKSILVDSKADILVYGMGERAILEIAKRLESGKNLEGIRGTMIWKSSLSDELFNGLTVHHLPSHEEVSYDKNAYNRMFREIIQLTDPHRDVALVQKQDTRYVIQYPPSPPLTQKEFDELYLFPYTRRVHPFYERLGKVRALEVVKFSITAVRGCFGGCSFCALTHHQTTHVISRSVDSILEEVKLLTKHPDFRGTIVDVGGPTANMWSTSCEVRNSHGQCPKNCLHPRVCRNLEHDGGAQFVDLLRKIKSVRGVKHVFVGSGIRHDLILDSPNADYVISALVDFTSGQLKLAPEHAHPHVLRLMRKPPVEKFLDFKRRFEEFAKRKGQRKYVIGYFIVGHPGEGEDENIYLKDFIVAYLNYIPQQVQIFTPTPGTASTTMYYTGIDPFTNEEVEVVKSERVRSLFKERIVNRSKRDEYRAEITD